MQAFKDCAAKYDGNIYSPNYEDKEIREIEKKVWAKLWADIGWFIDYCGAVVSEEEYDDVYSRKKKYRIRLEKDGEVAEFEFEEII